MDKYSIFSKLKSRCLDMLVNKGLIIDTFEFVKANYLNPNIFKVLGINEIVRFLNSISKYYEHKADIISYLQGNSNQINLNIIKMAQIDKAIKKEISVFLKSLVILHNKYSKTQLKFYKNLNNFSSVYFYKIDGNDFQTITKDVYTLVYNNTNYEDFITQSSITRNMIDTSISSEINQLELKNFQKSLFPLDTLNKKQLIDLIDEAFAVIESNEDILNYLTKCMKERKSYELDFIGRDVIDTTELEHLINKYI